MIKIKLTLADSPYDYKEPSCFYTGEVLLSQDGNTAIIKTGRDMYLMGAANRGSFSSIQSNGPFAQKYRKVDATLTIEG